MPKGTPRFRFRSELKKEYKAGKWYSIDDLSPYLPGAIIQNSFRKPLPGEKTPDGSRYTSEELDCDLSEYEVCIQSFRIRMIINYNAPEAVPPTDGGK